jgi:uncharacterized membrane protein YeaQ/YmgE (transglycosylase-associated protein family)
MSTKSYPRKQGTRDVHSRLDCAWIARRFHCRQDRQQQGAGFFLNIVLGIVGAVVGGEMFTALGESRVTGFNLYSLVVSVIGAIFVLIIYHAIAGRRVL